MFRTRTCIVAVAALATIGVAACSDSDREEIGDAVNSIAEDVEDAGRTAASEVEDAARTAVSEVGQAVDEAATDAAELAARNLATQQGEEQFADADHPLDGDGLSCAATATDGADAVEISCTGTTEDGGAAELTGSTNELPGASVTELEGNFTGTVDGTEVFTTEKLGG